MLNRVSAPPAKGSRRATTPAGASGKQRRSSGPPGWRNPFVLLAVAVVVVVVVVIAVIAGSRSTPSPSPSPRSEAQADQTLMAAVAGVPAATSASVGAGGLPSPFTPLSGAAPLQGANGRPQVLYVGADYCPYCAAERWSLVVALSRFGSFSRLHLTTSSSTDIYPDTATFSFHDASYTSSYIDFAGVETLDRTQAPLETMSPEQKTLFDTYDAAPYVPAQSAGGIPWLDVANRAVSISSNFNPGLLAGLAWGQIAAKLSTADDPVTIGIVGNANLITAEICKATGMQPSSVCQAAPIPALSTLVP